LISEVVPDARRIAVLWDANTGEDQLRAISAAAKAIPVDLQVIKFRDADEMESALSADLNKQPDALVQLSSPLFVELADHIASIAARFRVPAISMFGQFESSAALANYLQTGASARAISELKLLGSQGGL